MLFKLLLTNRERQREGARESKQKQNLIMELQG